MTSLIKNWQTLIGGLIAFSGVLGLLFHRIDLATAVMLIGTGATWVGVTGKDGNRGSNAPSAEADHVVANALIKGGPPAPRDLETGETVTK